MATDGSWAHHFGQWLRDRSDDIVLRWLFRAMIAATVTVVALDYAELDSVLAHRTAVPVDTPAPEPLPSVRPDESEPKGPATSPKGRMAGKMSFELAADGRLFAVGSITPGIAKAFAEEIEKRGSYVKTVVLQSPGGSVQDALAMGRLIRDKGFATEVVGGTYCASSCPLVFAGGIQRLAGKNAAIGVHQVSSFSENSSGGMAGAQQVSALCQKYLRDMGVDLGVWVHAMETPKERLYYFKADELLSLKLATSVAGAKPVAKKS